MIQQIMFFLQTFAQVWLQRLSTCSILMVICNKRNEQPVKKVLFPPHNK